MQVQKRPGTGKGGKGRHGIALDRRPLAPRNAARSACGIVSNEDENQSPSSGGVDRGTGPVETGARPGTLPEFAHYSKS